MDGMMLRTAAGERTGIALDPRTKLILLLTVTTLMFSTSNEGLMNIGHDPLCTRDHDGGLSGIFYDSQRICGGYGADAYFG